MNSRMMSLGSILLLVGCTTLETNHKTYKTPKRIYQSTPTVVIHSEPEKIVITDQIEPEESSTPKIQRPFLKPTEPIPAELSLLAQADQYRLNQKLHMAEATVERALRVSPKSAKAYLKLAQIKLESNQSKEAEQLALKALSLAQYQSATDKSTFFKSAWRVIYDARKTLGNNKGAEEAFNQLQFQSDI